VIHITTETKDQTFAIGTEWRLIFENKVPNVHFDTEFEAHQQLSRLQCLTDVIEDDFSIAPRRKLK